jgi:hypothetical protein
MDIMHKILISAVFVLTAAASAQAACYADYKAKQDDPLRLQYGVAEIRGECSVSGATEELAGRLSSDGWQLLEVLDVFDDSGLEERRDSAGEFFLRY